MPGQEGGTGVSSTAGARLRVNFRVPLVLPVLLQLVHHRVESKGSLLEDVADLPRSSSVMTRYSFRTTFVRGFPPGRVQLCPDTWPVGGSLSFFNETSKVGAEAGETYALVRGCGQLGSDRRPTEGSGQSGDAWRKRRRGLLRLQLVLCLEKEEEVV